MATAQFVSAAATLTGKTPAFIGGVTNNNLAPKLSDTKTKLTNNAAAAIKNGFKPEDVSILETTMSEYKISVAGDTDSNWRQGFAIPINLSIVLDGIKGFRFGNTITIDYLPDGYGDVVFTVTKIEHSITNNDWTTTLSTVCRTKV